MKCKNSIAGVMLLAICLPFAVAADLDRDTSRTDDKPGAATRSAGEQIDDATLTAKVKSALAGDEQVSALDVKVKTYRGVVQLSGFVDNSEVADRAGEIAGTVDGVKAVKNDIRIKQ